MILIKRMETASEMDGKAFVHYQSWQETYRGLLSDAYLDDMSLEKCRAIARRWPDRILVAKDGERVVGFVGYDANRDPSMPGTGEIVAIYLLAEYQGQGIGYRLMHAAMEQMADDHAVVLWVLKGNEVAIRFYQRYGFRFDGTEKQLLIGDTVTEQRMVYCHD